MNLQRNIRLVTGAVVASLVAALVLLIPGSAAAHASGHTVNVYSPIVGASTWDRFGYSPPATHHRVFSNWGYLNDWSTSTAAPVPPSCPRSVPPRRQATPCESPL